MIFERWFVTFCIIFRFLASARHAVEYNCTAEAEIQKNCRILTSDTYDYVDFLPIGEENYNKNTTIVFYVKGDAGASILLSEEQSSVDGFICEITLGDKNNTRSVIRTELSTSDYGVEKINNETNIISSSEWREFWIHITVDGLISVGKQNAREPFMSWSNPDGIGSVNFYSFTSENNHAVHWIYQCSNQSEDRLIKYHEEKLKCDLFSKYDFYATPENSTKMTIDILVDTIYLDTANGELQLYGPANVSWVDENLCWEPKDYNGQHHLDISEDSIRDPPIIDVNRQHTPMVHSYEKKKSVSENGSVIWPTEVRIESKCKKDNWTFWPIELYTCQLEFFSEAQEVEIHIINDSIFNTTSSAWTIKKMKRKNLKHIRYHLFETNAVSLLSMELTLERNVSRMKHWDCRNIESKPSKLNCQLFLKYNRSFPPPNLLRHEVQVLLITSFYADLDIQGIFQVIGEVTGVWKDERLAWEPHEYGGIKILDIEGESWKIWRPDVTLKNTAFSTDQPFGSGRGKIMHNGIVHWTASLNIQSKCNIDMANWSQTSHTCQLNLTIDIPEVEIVINNGKNATIQSPWMIEKTRIVNFTKGADLLNHSLSIEIQIQKNIDRLQSSRCISFTGNYEEKLNCHLNSKHNLSTPAWDVVFDGPRIAMKISYIDLNIENGILRLDGAVKMKWKDDRLAWDPDKFGGQFFLNIGETQTNPVWKPSFVLANDDFNDNPFNFGRLVSTSNGDLTWFSPMNIKVKCNMISKSWPWDPQICWLHFHIDAYTVHLNFSKEGYFETISSWKIINIDVKKTYHKFRLEVTLQKNSVSLQIVLCSIFVVINAIVLPSFLIPPSKKIKTVAKATSFLLLVLFLLLLEYSIPHFTSQAYNFFIGYVILLLIVGISSGPTAYLVRLAETSSSQYPSLKMNLIEQQENQSKEDTIKRSLIEEKTQRSPLNEFQRDWLKIAIVIERLLFIICTALVLILTVSF